MASTASSSVGHITSHAWAHHICVLFVVSSSTMHHCARDYAQVERADEQWRRSLHRYGAHYLSLSPLRLAIYTICILLRATCVTIQYFRIRPLIHAVWFIRDTSIRDIVESPDKLRDILMRGLLVHNQLRDTAVSKIQISV